MYVNGTLLDDLGLPLQIDGVDSIAVVYLLIDGVPVSSVQSNASDGMFMFSWDSPENIGAGLTISRLDSMVVETGLTQSVMVTVLILNSTIQA